MSADRLELLEAKWTELPAEGDAVNLDFVRNAVGKSRVASAGIICRSPNSFPIADGIRALPLNGTGIVIWTRARMFRDGGADFHAHRQSRRSVYPSNLINIIDIFVCLGTFLLR